MAGFLSNIIGSIRAMFSNTFRPRKLIRCPGCHEWLSHEEAGLFSMGGLRYHSVACLLKSIEEQQKGDV